MLDGVALAVIAYPLLAGWVIYEQLRAGSRARTFMTAVFAIYLIEVVRVTLFPIPVDRAVADVFLPSWVTPTNFALFERMGTMAQIQGNILMGVPFGLLSWFVFRRLSMLRVLLAGIVTFGMIEVLQLVIGLAIGVPGYRILDINDLILNTSGVMVGIVGFLIVRSLFRLLDRRAGDPGPLRAYLRSVLGSGEPSPLAATSL